MEVFLAISAVLAFLYGLHHLALWAEDRGWIYYKRRKPSSSVLGNAFLEVQALIEPEKKNLVEVRCADSVEEDDQGDPPEAGSG